MKILGLITARGGSKGIPRKNIKMLGEKPLIVWSIEAALQSKLLDRVVVSTDDEEIAVIASEAGADVPFMRPSNLSGDQVAGVDPVLHALKCLPECDGVLLLQPTSPLRTSEDIDGCLDFAVSQTASSVVSVSEASVHPHWTYRVNMNQTLDPIVVSDSVVRRQELPKAYAVNGAMYYAKAEWLFESKDFMTSDTLAYIMPTERSVDIDTLLDWKLAEILLEERRNISS